jgi:N-methylhydantoinase B
LRELAGRYGVARVERNCRALCDYSERLIRARIASLPAGQYKFTDCLDDDGLGGPALPIQVAITLSARGRARVDFTGTAPQSRGPVNANHAVTVSATMYVFRCLLQGDVPFTSGLLRPIEIINPVGCLTNAQPPAAMAAGNVETSQRITDTLLGALAQAAPDAIPAASSGTMNNLSFGGWDTLRARPFAYYETIAGGMGAGPRFDGLSARHTHMTNSLNTPVEAFEHEYPLRVRSYRIRANSGGAGKRRGGDGIVKQLEFLEPAEVTILSDRRRNGPYGLAGGQDGKPGRNACNGEGIGGKARFPVQPGDVVTIETPGGGGHGR